MDQVYNLTQAYSQAPWRKQLQYIGLFLLALVFMALVAGIYLNVTARAAKVGREIQYLQGKISETEQTNADLQSQLAFITSGAQMEKRAEDLGFQTIGLDEQVYLSVPGYVNRQPVDLAPAPAPVKTITAVIPAIYTESIFEWLRQQIVLSPLFISRQQP